MNQDEAERCLDIAKEAEKQGNIEKALKFYEKSLKLYPNSKAEEGIARLKSKTQPSGEPNLRHRTSHATNSNNENENTSKKYTNEQQESVAKIIKCTNYYEILNVSKTATEEEIKRSYKKLALQMHPDKNQAPGAEEAFKKIGQAFSCLSDSQNRKMYDLRGSEEPTSPSMRTRHEWDGDLTPEEIFSMFFGGGIPVRRGGFSAGGGSPPIFRTYTYSSPRGFRRGDSDEEDIFHHQRPRRTSARQNQQASETSLIFTILQFLPLLLLIFYAFFSSPSEPTFQFTKSGKFNKEMTTSEHGFKYYVKPDFDLQLRTQTDNQVEETWISHLQEKCYRDLQYSRYRRSKEDPESCKELDNKKIPRPRAW